jgi:hypothetical protein
VFDENGGVNRKGWVLGTGLSERKHEAINMLLEQNVFLGGRFRRNASSIFFEKVGF